MMPLTTVRWSADRWCNRRLAGKSGAIFANAASISSPRPTIAPDHAASPGGRVGYQGHDRFLRHTRQRFAKQLISWRHWGASRRAKRVAHLQLVLRPTLLSVANAHGRGSGFQASVGAG